MQEIQYFSTSVGRLTDLSNSGKRWDSEELASLRHNYNLGLDLTEICTRHKRPKSGVLNKLCELRILRYSSANYSYIVVAKPKNVNKVETEKETIMSNANIETKVFIQGKDATEMTDAQIFSLIAKLESEQDKLSQIKNKPKKLVAAIHALTLDIEMLVEYVDGR
jgi:hypothetical protein